ncbi:MAG: helix-turn-helix domain-containing protein [Pseudomonadota bacterium]
MARTYNQDCTLAHALDILGERWTLLIIRNLLLGPQRFGDLQSGLAGIGANLLSKRLKDLEEAGILLSPGANETRGQYRLSVDGEALRPALRELMYWSIVYFLNLSKPTTAMEIIKSNDLQPDSVAFAIELFAKGEEDPALNYVAHLFVDDYPYTFFYMNNEMIARRGADSPAVATLRTDVPTVMKALRRNFSMKEAKERIECDGDETAIDHLLQCITRANSTVKLIRAAG